MKQVRYAMLLALITGLGSTVALATDDGNFSIGIAVGLPATDTIINLSNSGASWGALFNMPGSTTLTAGSGNICANVYVFSADEQEQACCACPMTPNSIWSLSGVSDLTSNTLTGVHPSSIVIKVVASEAAAINPTCDPTTVNVTKPNTGMGGGAIQVGQPLASGLLAWQHQTGGDNVPLVSSTLSAAELNSAVFFCSSIHKLGSGHGICAQAGCTLGGR